MPANFLTADQRRYYGRYTTDLLPQHFGHYFHLDDADRHFIRSHTKKSHTILGIAVQIGTVRFLGRFLTDWQAVPESVICYLAVQLRLEPDGWTEYLERPQTIYAHRQTICDHFGYREFSDPIERFALIRWLYARVWLSDEPPAQLFDLTVLRLKKRKVLLPGITVLARLINQIRDRVQNRIWTRLNQQLTEVQCESLKALVEGDGVNPTALVRLRRGPVAISPPAMKEALERIQEIRQIAVGDLDVSWLSPDRLKKLARYAALSKGVTIRQLQGARRLATLAAFAYVYETRAIDDALDLFDALVQIRLTRAGQTGEKKRLRTLRDLDAAALTLREVCQFLLALQEDDEIRLGETLFKIIPRQQLTHAVEQVETLTRPPDDKYYENLLGHYSQFRRFLPLLRESIEFQGVNDTDAILAAISFLKQLDQMNVARLRKAKQVSAVDRAPRGVITRIWKPLVIDTEGHIHQRFYTFCVLLQLRDALRRRTIFVPQSARWDDLRVKLLSDTDWNRVRLQVCRSLEHETEPEAELRALEQQLDALYQRVNDNLADNDDVRLEEIGGKLSLIVSPLEAQEEHPSLIALRQAVNSLLPRVDIPDLVLEIATRTGFLKEFTHISESRARAEDLHLSLSAVLLAEALNIGFEPFVQSTVPALTRGRLSWVQQNYVRTETIIEANVHLVAAQDQVPLAHAWGGGEVAVADGLRFVVPVRSVHAGASRRYFGRKRGVTYYNLMSNQYSGLHGIVITGALRDAPYLLECLLEQETHLRPAEVITDTGGYSDIVFALFWLLGYQFSPRLADMKDARYWRMSRDTDYGQLNGIARQTTNRRLITENWDDFLRTAGSLKMGIVKASELFGRSTTPDAHPPWDTPSANWVAFPRRCTF